MNVVPLRRRASVFIDEHAPTDEMEPSLIEWPEDTDDIVGPVLVLVVTLLGFLVLLACTGFTLRRGHGVVFLALYLAFLVWAVAKEY